MCCSVVASRYGIGFKSGAMRLAKDALVITVEHHADVAARTGADGSLLGPTATIALLSQTFLDDINAEEIYIPMLTYHMDATSRDAQPDPSMDSTKWSSSLQFILM